MLPQESIHNFSNDVYISDSETSTLSSGKPTLYFVESDPKVSEFSVAQSCAIESAAKTNFGRHVKVVLPAGSAVQLPAYLTDKYGPRIAKETVDFANDVTKVIVDKQRP